MLGDARPETSVGEFENIELLEFCKFKKWDYAIRTANNTLIYENEGDAFNAKNLATPKEHNLLFIK